jgi:hypothetical protein
MKQLASRRRWVDALLIAGGIYVVSIGWPVVGIPLMAFGALSPLLVLANRRSAPEDLLRLVPRDVASAYRSLREAALLAGAPADARQVVETADDSLLEIAAHLGGRPPRGAAQRRFVARHVLLFHDDDASMRARHEAWVAAHAELDAISPVVETVSATQSRLRLTVALFVALIVPFVVMWDVIGGAGRMVVLTVEAVALRCRIVLQLIRRGTDWLVHALREAFALIRAWRSRLVDAVSEARQRVIAMRLGVRRRMRLAARGSRLT